MAYFIRSRAVCPVITLAAALLLTCGINVPPARGQAVFPDFYPHVNGLVRTVVVQPDGKVLIGGDFTEIFPTGTRNRIARLNRDGTVDATFNPNASGPVYAIALQADGNIIVGGNFAAIGGQSRANIARLEATTGAADSFSPDASMPIYALAVQPDGKILAGGSFVTIGGQTRLSIARLDPSTGQADSFNPSANNSVNAITLKADGRILLGGDFTSLSPNGGGTVTRNYLARINPDGTLDNAFVPNANGSVASFAIQVDGKIIIAGAFTTVGGQARNRIARLNPADGQPDSFDPNANAAVRKVLIQRDGKILVGGNFDGLSAIAGQMRRRIARLDPVTGQADSYDPSANGEIYAIALQSDGNALVAGDFTGFNPAGGSLILRDRLARLERDGRVERRFDFNVLDGSGVYSTVTQPDDTIVIGGSFSSPNRNFVKINSDASFNLQFFPDPNGAVYSIVTQPDGKILVGGTFTSIGGQTRNRIARLDPATGSAEAFDPSASNYVTCLTPQADGKILVGGNFTSIGGQVRNRVARLDPTTGLADSFDPNANGVVQSIQVQADGQILIGGNFTSIGGQSRNRLARLDPNTGLADSFNPNANAPVACIMQQADGRILVGGSFSAIGGQARNNIARLNPKTGLADEFNPDANSSVTSITMQSDGKVLVGGLFFMIGGQPRFRLARLDGTTGASDDFNFGLDDFAYSVASQSDGTIVLGGLFYSDSSHVVRITNDTLPFIELDVTPTAVTQSRSGSVPQLSHVTFEQSTDNGATFTFLGTATPSFAPFAPNPKTKASSATIEYTLTGLHLPLAQNILIRARGYHRTGLNNGSETIEDTVRNAFLLVPVEVSAAVSRKTHGATDFDIPLPLTGEPGVECRSSSDAHTLIFTFNNNVLSGNASVTAGIGSVSSLTFSGNIMNVNLTGVADVQQISVTLSNVTDSFAQILPNTAVLMKILAGDVNGNSSVNVGDVASTKSQSGLAVTGANFKNDVNVNGSINVGDIALVKSKSGNTLP